MPAKRSSSFRCRYLPYEYHGRVIKLPAVLVRLSDFTGSNINSFALVDSGATVSFLPLELAEILDSPVTGEEVESEGAGGCFKTRRIKLIAEMVKGKTVCWSGKVDFLVPTEYKRIPYVVLGRDSIFKAFDITFCENLQKTEFRKSRRR